MAIAVEAGVRPQPKIDAQHIAVRRALLQNFDKPTRHPHEGRCRLAQMLRASRSPDRRK